MKVRIKYRTQIAENERLIRAALAQSHEIVLPGKRILSAPEKKRWEKLFLEFNQYRPAEAPVMAKHFADENVELVKQAYKERIEEKEPILICNVKNDLDRIKMVLAHHKKLGIRYFAVLDNDSDDGTLEWLLEQDIDVFRVREKYTSVVRAAWIAKAAAYYGLNRWFVIVDSDELLVYEGMESKPVQEMIQWMEEHQLERGLAFMIDMYAKSSDLKKQGTKKDIFRHYRYFDTSSYRKENGITQINIFGGPRERKFGREKGVLPELLTKYPLVYWREGELYRYHFMFPFEKNYASPCFLGLFHYKFLDGDYDKYVRIVQEGNYAGGSALYKKYLRKIEEDGRISFMDEQSCEFTGSEDLKRIKVFEGRL